MSGHSQFALLKQRRFLPFFVVQGLGAFNDNVYRQAIIGLLFYLGVTPEQRTLYTNLAPALFILPYFLFSALAGQIAEKLEKSRLVVITTTMEIAIMSLAAVGFLTENMAVLLVALFCTGLQSTLFGPVKYSILPSVLKPEELTGGNGLVEMGTSISILCGMILGGLIFQIAGSHGPVAAATAVIALAVTGNLVARLIPKVDAGAPELKINWNPLPESLAIMRLTRRQLAVRNAVLGVSWFWFVGTVLTAQLPTYAELNLGGAQDLYIFALALFSIGTGTGSLLCEKLSGRTVEIGLVPLGAFGISAFMLDLYFARPGGALQAGLGIGQFVHQAGSWRIMLDLVGIGLCTGLFVVPLFALIQSRTPKAELSRVIAGLNIQNSMFIFIAAMVGIALQMQQLTLFGVRVPMPGLSIPQVFLALAIANAVVAIWIFSIVPEFLMRFLSWVMVRALYRLRLHGIARHVPDEGAALIVCNHVSYMDALVLAASIPRPVRFVMYYRIFNIPVMRWIFRTAKAIPIAGAREDPALMQRAFDAIDAALAEGELVCIFPEGALTKDGAIAKFKSGVEKILERRAVPVLPMALRNMWTSMWSKRDSRLRRMRVPRRFRAHVEVIAGAPMAAAEASA
ncbi:MFS transporter, partial [Xanthomonas translucens]